MAGHLALATLLGSAASSAAGASQPVLPSQVTPPSAAPIATPDAGRVLPSAPVDSGAEPSPDAAFPLALAGADLTGGFRELTSANARFERRVREQVRTLADLLAAARSLEQAYGEAGYVFARVVVPPQRLVPGGTARVLVVDGFVEAVDADGVPAPARASVRARLAGLIGRRHVRLADVERAVLLAGEVPGVVLRSAVSPGDSPGGVRLIVTGTLDRWQGRVTIDNRLPASLGAWQWNASLVGNGVLGAGEQTYLYLGSQADVARHGLGRPRLGTVGAGTLVPISTRGLALGADLILARTEPDRVPNAPRTVGAFSRAQMALNAALERSRRTSLDLRVGIDRIVQSNTAPDFSTRLSHDSYSALRLALTWRDQHRSGMRWLNLAFARGIHGKAETALVPHSRSGARNSFTTLQGNARVTQRLGVDMAVDLQARGLTGLGRPLFLSEQFALAADNAVSGLPGGSLTVDSGATLRGEVILPAAVLPRLARVEPYAFAAGGTGTVVRPTAVEQAHVRAASVGLGIRMNGLRQPGPVGQLGLEVARQFNNLPGRSGDVRVNFTFSQRL